MVVEELEEVDLEDGGERARSRTWGQMTDSCCRLLIY